MSSAPRLYTVSEVAEIMRVHKVTIYRMIHSGDLPAIRMGKSFRIPQNVLEQMLNFEDGSAGSQGRRKAQNY